MKNWCYNIAALRWRGQSQNPSWKRISLDLPDRSSWPGNVFHIHRSFSDWVYSGNHIAYFESVWLSLWWQNERCNGADVHMTTKRETGEIHKHLSYWRSTHIVGRCNGSYAKDNSSVRPGSTTNKLFKNESSWRTYLSLRVNEAKETVETFILLIAGLDSITVCFIDCLNNPVEDFETNSLSRKRVEETFLANSDFLPTASNYQMSQRWWERKGMESIRLLKKFLTEAASHLTIFCCDEYNLQCSAFGTKWDKLSLVSDRWELTQSGIRSRNGFNNPNNTDKTSFWYPGNRHAYVSLAFKSSPELIRDWIEEVSDYYILYAKSVKIVLCQFHDANILDFIGKSDDDDNNETSRGVLGKETNEVEVRKGELDLLAKRKRDSIPERRSTRKFLSSVIFVLFWDMSHLK